MQGAHTAGYAGVRDWVHAEFSMYPLHLEIKQEAP